MIYDFKCDVCGAIETDKILTMDHTNDQHPKCCYGEPMRHYHTKAPYVAWIDRQLLDGGFKANHDGTEITSVKQNREYMKRHGLQDANEVFEKPTLESEMAERQAGQDAIDAITPTADEMKMLHETGIVDADGQLNE